MRENQMMIDTVTNWIYDTTGITAEYQEKIFLSILAITIIFVIRWLILRITYRNELPLKTKYRINKTSSYIATIILIIVITQIWFKNQENN